MEREREGEGDREREREREQRKGVCGCLGIGERGMGGGIHKHLLPAYPLLVGRRGKAMGGSKLPDTLARSPLITGLIKGSLRGTEEAGPPSLGAEVNWLERKGNRNTGRRRGNPCLGGASVCCVLSLLTFPLPLICG